MTIPQQIIDAHHHLWDLSHCHYPWLMERGVRRFFGDPTPIQKDYLATDFISDHAELPIVKSVHVQVGAQVQDSLKETMWLQSVADRHGFPHAIVAFCDLTSPRVERDLEAHAAAANLRGIRQIVGRSAEEDAKTGTAILLANPDFAKGLRYLAEHGLSFDLQLTPPLLAEAARLFCAIPETPLALCHCASLSDYSPDGIALWQAGLKRMAEHENILCKISGFGMFNPDWTSETIRGAVLTAIDIFGTHRIAFASNFPVDKLTANYRDIFEAYLEITKGFSNSERQAMFYNNAAQFYRIESGLG